MNPQLFFAIAILVLTVVGGSVGGILAERITDEKKRQRFTIVYLLGIVLAVVVMLFLLPAGGQAPDFFTK